MYRAGPGLRDFVVQVRRPHFECNCTNDGVTALWALQLVLSTACRAMRIVLGGIGVKLAADAMGAQTGP